MNVHISQHMTADSLHTNRYSAYGVSAPTPDEEEKIKYAWKRALEEEEQERHGEWPNPYESEDKRNRWLNKVHHVLWPFFKHSGIGQQSNIRDCVADTKDIVLVRGQYTKEAVLEEARITLQLYRQGVRESQKQARKEVAMSAKKQAPAHVATPDEAAAAKAAFSKSANGSDNAIARQVTALRAAVARINRELNYRDNGSLLLRGLWRKYDGATTEEQVVKHPAYVLLHFEQDYIAEITRVRTPLPQVTTEQIDAELAATQTDQDRADLALLAKAAKAAKEEADKFFPRDKHNQPLEDGKNMSFNSQEDYEQSLADEAEANQLADADSHSPDEPTPKDERDFGPLWETATNFGYTEREVHKFFGVVNSLKELSGTVQELTIKFVKANPSRKVISEKSPEPTPDNAPKMSTPAAPEKAPNVETAPTGIPTAGTQNQEPLIAPPVAKPNGVEKSEPKTPKYTAPLAIQTLNGIPMGMIRQELDKPLPPQAYKEIAYGSMKGNTDIDVERIRDRFDQVFGPQGLGWAIEPIQGESQILTSSEVRMGGKDKAVEQTWYVTDLVNYRLRYTVILPDGSLKDCHGTAMSDSGDNMDRGYALEGTMSSLIKQAYRRMGGMNHIYYGTYTHVQAKHDLKTA